MTEQAQKRRSPGSQAIAMLLDEFYQTGKTGINWAQDLDGEALELHLKVGQVASVNSVTYLADGIVQVSRPTTFDPIRCAGSLRRAIEARKGGR